MSNVALFNPAQAPAFAKNRGELSALAKSLAGGAGGNSFGKRISIKGGVFRLLASGKEIAAIEERHLDVVVINAAPKVSRVFYAKKYDAATVSAPDCWSPDGEKPAAESENKQASRCSECSQNIAGSGQNNSRACRYQQRIAVVLANDMGGDVLQLTLPATSVFGKEDGDKRGLQAYARWLMAQNIDPAEVITRMKFDTKSESPKLHFMPTRWLTDDEHAGVVDQGKSDAAIKAITMTVSKQDGVSSAPLSLEGKRPAAAVAKEAQAPKAEKAAPVEEEDEPVVRKEEKKASSVPASKASLADMVDDWDDE
tara:strand:+ start:1510 stop:2442 length:933 start_codon:yes stop_codon:yes gene_type:complete